MSDKDNDELIAALERIDQTLEQVTRRLAMPLTVDANAIANSIGDRLEQVAAAALRDEIPVRIGKTLHVRQEQPAKYTEGDIKSAAVTTRIFTDNPLRLGGTIYNNSTAILYVRLGEQASSTQFSVALAALTGGIGGYYELPFGYTGPVTGAWASANGNCYTTELSLAGL